LSSTATRGRFDTAASRTEPGVYLANEPTLLQATIPVGVKPGTYQFLSALVRHGSLAGNTVAPDDILAIDVKALTISP
jgi:hypothetical protein